MQLLLLIYKELIVAVSTINFFSQYTWYSVLIDNYSSFWYVTQVLYIKKQWSQSDTPIRYRTILIKSILEVLKILLRLLRLKVEGEKITSKNVLRPWNMWTDFSTHWRHPCHYISQQSRVSYMFLKVALRRSPIEALRLSYISGHFYGKSNLVPFLIGCLTGLKPDLQG